MPATLPSARSSTTPTFIRKQVLSSASSAAMRRYVRIFIMCRPRSTPVTTDAPGADDWTAPAWV